MNPFDDEFNPFEAALAKLRAPRAPLQQPQAPAQTPEESRDLLGGVLEGGLGGLAYIGKTLDKPGRAVRGLLGGKPQELLNLVPFSDAVGLTDERDTVNGTDITDSLGLTSKSDDSWGRTGLGFGAELALDPLTYVGVGPLTKAGTLAKKAGALPKGFLPKMGGYDVAESALQGLRTRPEQTLSDLAAGYGTANALGRPTRVLPQALETAGVKTGQPLADLIGLGLPGMDPIATFGKAGNPFAEKIAGGLDKIGGAIGGNVAVRSLRAALDPQVEGAFSRQGQQLASDVLRPARRGYQRDAATAYTGLLQQIDPFVQRDEGAVANAVRQFMENKEALTPGSATPTNLLRDRAVAGLGTAGFSPAEIAQIQTIGEQMGGIQRGWGAVERGRGLNTGDLADDAVSYAARSKNVLPRQPGESLLQSLARRGGEMSATHSSQIGRQEMFSNVPGGTVALNDYAKNAALRQMNPPALEAFFRQELTGSAAVNASGDINKQARDLSKWVQGLPEVHSKEGVDFFRTDPFADFMMRGQRHAAAMSAADTVMEGATRFAEPAADVLARGGAGVPVEQLMADMGFKRTGASVNPGQRALMDRLGLGGNAIKDMVVPVEIANDMKRMGMAWQNPQELAPVAAGWDYLNNLFKGSVTAYFPAFHARNLVSGLFNQWRDGAFSLASNKNAYDVVRGGTLEAPLPGMLARTPQEATQELIREAVAGNVAFTRGSGRTGDIAGQAGSNLVARAPSPTASGNSLIGDVFQGAKDAIPKTREQLNPLNVEGVGRDADVFAPMRVARNVQGKIDDTVQLGHYIELRKQGYTPDAAALKVKRLHLDYQDLTGTERNILKRVMPWYCVPTDHQILTRDGWKNHDQLTIGEDVMSYDHGSGSMQWTPLQDVAVFDYDGELMRLGCRGSSFEFTANHRWPVVSAGSGRRSFAEGCELNTNQLIPLTGEFTGQDSVLSPRLAAILAWVVTDGTFRWRRGHCEMVIYQADHKFGEKIMALTGKLPRLAEDRRGRPVKTYPVALEDMKEITRHFHSKADLPAIFAKLSRAAAEAAYQAMIDAEGCMSGPNLAVQCFAQSKKNQPVIEAFQIACVLTGRSAFQSKVGCYVRGVKHMRVNNWKMPSVNYVGKIWCPSTAHGTWVMKHEGAICITGNTFSRKSLPPLLEELATNPGKLAGSIRLASGVREPFDFVPGFVAEGASLPFPVGQPDGQKRYISSFGLPFEDEAFQTLGSLASGDLSRVAQKTLGMANPLIKTPIEAATGVQLSSGRKLEDLKPYGIFNNQSVLDEEQSRIASQILANTPASRFFTTINRATDPKKGTPETLTNLLSGVRISDVDEAKQLDIAAREELEKRLRGKPGVKASEKLYVPADKMWMLDPMEQQLYAAYQAAQQRIRKQAEQRPK